MSISPHCDRCSKELKTYGAILLGPPDAQNKVDKLHICLSCYEQMIAEIRNHR